MACRESSRLRRQLMPPDEITISIARSPGETAQNNDARQTQRPLEIGTYRSVAAGPTVGSSRSWRRAVERAITGEVVRPGRSDTQLITRPPTVLDEPEADAITGRSVRADTEWSLAHGCGDSALSICAS